MIFDLNQLTLDLNQMAFDLNQLMFNERKIPFYVDKMTFDLNQMMFDCHQASFADLQLIHKINRNNAFGNAFAHRRNFLVVRMVGVKIQSRAVWIDGDQTRVERTLKMQNVAPNRKAQNIRNNVRQIAQFFDMFFAFRF